MSLLRQEFYTQDSESNAKLSKYTVLVKHCEDVKMYDRNRGCLLLSILYATYTVTEKTKAIDITYNINLDSTQCILTKFCAFDSDCSTCKRIARITLIITR